MASKGKNGKKSDKKGYNPTLVERKKMEREAAALAAEANKPDVVIDPSVRPTVTLVDIKVSDDETKALVTSALDEADEYRKVVEEEIKRLKDEAEQLKIDAQTEYNTKKSEAEMLVADAIAKNQTIIDSEKARLQKETEDLKNVLIEESNNKLKNLEEKFEEEKQALIKKELELEENNRKALEQLKQLEILKITIKSDIQEELKTEFEKLIAEKDSIFKQCENLKLELKNSEHKYKILQADHAIYDEQLEELDKFRIQLAEAQYNVKSWTKKYESVEKLYQEMMQKNADLNAEILKFGSDPQKAVIEIKHLTDELKRYKDMIANLDIGEEELTTLRSKAKALEEMTNKYKKLLEEKNEIESKHFEQQALIDEVENCRRFIKLLELQKSELERELKHNIDLYSKRSEKIFANLSAIDETKPHDYPNYKITLRELCEKFRGYMANRNLDPLYYSEETIRTFIAGFASARLMILEGLSGTGKSSLPRAFMKFINGGSDEVEAIEIPVQSSWKDRNDLLGFYNDFKKQYKETDFLKAIYTASHNKNVNYLIVLDEMNLSRIEYYFADVLSVLEKNDPNKWDIDLIPDYASMPQLPDAWPKQVHEGKLKITDNTWFIGTANKDDSTFAITDKVYDRAVVLEFDSKGEYDKTTKYFDPIYLNHEDFANMLDEAIRKMSESEKERFKNMIKTLDDDVKSLFSVTFGNRIANQLEKFVPVFVECGGTKEEAVDIMFSRKVLRKLEGKYDDDTKQGLETLLEDINDKYQNKLPHTVRTIKDMIGKII